MVPFLLAVVLIFVLLAVKAELNYRQFVCLGEKIHAFKVEDEESLRIGEEICLHLRACNPLEIVLNPLIWTQAALDRAVLGDLEI